MVGDLLLGLLAGALVAAVTTPVGVSGAVFLLPIQLSVLQVPNPSVTPTNLLYNVIAAPGALFRYRRTGHATGALARRLLVGTVPGVVVGAVVRVFLLPDARSFRVIAGVVLLIIGGWLLKRTLAPPSKVTPWPSRRLVAVAFAVGIVGGVYGVGGGSLLSPLLVGSGMAVAAVAPAALASTFVTSVVGALSYRRALPVRRRFHRAGLAARDRLRTRRTRGWVRRGAAPATGARARTAVSPRRSRRRHRHRVLGAGPRLSAGLVLRPTWLPAPHATHDEEHEGNDRQDDENGPQHGAVPSVGASTLAGVASPGV